MLLDGALEQTTTSYPLSTIRKLRALGSVMRTQDSSKTVTFEFDTAPPLRLELGATYEEAGVGASLWDASIALALFQRSRMVPLPSAAHVVELGAGLGLPSLDLARWSSDSVSSVTLTDSRSQLLSLAERNADAIRESQLLTADVGAEYLQWGSSAASEPPTSTGVEAAVRRDFDVVLGSDICYMEDSVPALAELLEKLRAPLTLIIGPAGRPSYQLLRKLLQASARLKVEERMLTLVCMNADDGPTQAEGWEAKDEGAMVRSSGVHSLLVISPSAEGDGL
jgi:predicted nicotinamide N-methyase